MSSMKIRFDDRKFKRELQKRIEDITYNNIVEGVSIAICVVTIRRGRGL